MLRDEQVLARVMAGERRDFGILAERHLPAARAAAYGRLGNRPEVPSQHAIGPRVTGWLAGKGLQRHDAEDLAQAAIAQWLEARANGSPMRDPVAYLYGIVSNLLKQEWQARCKVREIAQQPDGAAPVPPVDPGAAAEEAERDVLVHEAFAQLSQRNRQVLDLRYWRGLSQQATAEALGISRSSVQCHERRALAALRRTLEPRLRG